MLLFHSFAWLIMTTAGIYVSSLARNLVHAISILVPFGIGLGLALAGGLWLVETFGPPLDGYAAIPTGPHFMAVTGLLLFLAVLWLAWRNSAPGRGEGFALSANLSLLATAWVAGVLLVSGTRARAWEWLRPEPKPMPALSPHPEVHPAVMVSHDRVAVLTPDGNLWLYGPDPGRGARENQVNDTQPPAEIRRLGEAHPWVNFSATDNQLYAVRSDGTLWHWGLAFEPDPERPGRFRTSGDFAASWESPTQVGADADWQQVSAAWGHTVALKRNGTLWGWGSNNKGQLGQAETDFVAAPTRIGGESHWRHITAGPGNTLAANNEGEVWEWGWVGQPPRDTGEDARRLWVPQRIASGMGWQKLFTTAGENLGLSTRGEIWILRQWSWVLPAKQPFPVRWQGSPARDAVLGGGFAWSIDDQGSLLRWTADPGALYQAYSVPLVDASRQVGGRTDWIALGGTFGGHTCFGLTADGGLWTWGVPFDRQSVWLPPSQRPRQVALLRMDGN
jgi:hypothetical protein